MRDANGLVPELSPSNVQRQSGVIPGSTLTTVLIVVVAVAALYFGREVLVPIALALLLSFILAPSVNFLQSWHLPRTIAVMVVGIVAFTAIFGLGALMVSQVNQLAGDLPGYQSTLRDKIQSLRGVAGGAGTLERASAVLQDLRKEINKPNVSPSIAPIAARPSRRPRVPIAPRKTPDRSFSQ